MLQLSSARLGSDLARAGGLPARLGSARAVLRASSVRNILLKQAEFFFEIDFVKYNGNQVVGCWDRGTCLPLFSEWYSSTSSLIKNINKISNLCNNSLCLKKKFQLSQLVSQKHQLGSTRIRRTASSAQLANFQLGCITTKYFVPNSHLDLRPKFSK